jgi:hypothetical protein
VDYLKKDAALIVENTLPELSEAGTANSSLAEAFNRTLLVIMADTPEERARYRKELKAFSEQTTQALKLYQGRKFTLGESARYDGVAERREKYVQAREQVLQLVDREKSTEAMALFKTTMLPAYLDYKSAAEKMLRSNTSEGKSRGEMILRICTVTQYVVAGAGIILFVIGFTIGLLR